MIKKIYNIIKDVRKVYSLRERDYLYIRSTNGKVYKNTKLSGVQFNCLRILPGFLTFSSGYTTTILDGIIWGGDRIISKEEGDALMMLRELEK